MHYSRINRRTNVVRLDTFVIVSLSGYILIGSTIFFLYIRGFYDSFNSLDSNTNSISMKIQNEIDSFENIFNSYLGCINLTCTALEPFTNMIMVWGGCWNSLNNTTPDGSPIVSGVGENGLVYYVCVPSINVTNIDGNVDWGIGDLLIFDGNISMWLKVDGSPMPPVNVSLSDVGDGLSLIKDGTERHFIIRDISCGSKVDCIDQPDTLTIKRKNPAAFSGVFTPELEWISTPLLSLDGGMPTIRYYKPNATFVVTGGIRSRCSYFRIGNIVQVSCVIHLDVSHGGFDFIDVGGPSPCAGICTGPFTEFVMQMELAGLDTEIEFANAFVVMGEGGIQSAQWNGLNNTAYIARACGVGMIRNLNAAASSITFQFWWFNGVWGDQCIGEDEDQVITMDFSYEIVD